MALTQRPSHDVTEALLARHGRTFADELHIDLTADDPAALYRLLCFAMLAGMRLHHRIALDAAEALSRAGWVTPQAMLAADFDRRVRLLNRAGCARCDERVAAALGDASQALVERYDGQLAHLRHAAAGDRDQARTLLTELPGVAKAAVDVFCREAQLVWDELYPFADPLALRGAAWLGLPADAPGLAALTRDPQQMVRLVAALVRMELEYDFEEIRRAVG